MPGRSNFVVRLLTLVRWGLRALVQAGIDAGRAWIIYPNAHRVAVYQRTERDGRLVRHGRRPYSRKEVMKLKSKAVRQVFPASIKLGLARSVVIPCFREEGLLANLLHVLEVVHRVRPDASVHVDWVLKGTETGFRYGDVGDNVWTRLFQTLGARLPGLGHTTASRVDFAFWGTGKDHLTGRRLREHRNVYNSTVLKWIKISNKRVLEQVSQTYMQFMEGRFCIGIHRRVGNAMVANIQSEGKVPSLELFIKSVESIVTREGGTDYAIFLATDDAEAVEAFKRAFGSRLMVRGGVQRTTADATEVHFREWNHLSIADAEDVLIDTVLLSKCDVLVHASSSVSTVASIMNPALTLVRP